MPIPTLSSFRVPAGATIESLIDGIPVYAPNAGDLTSGNFGGPPTVAESGHLMGGFHTPIPGAPPNEIILALNAQGIRLGAPIEFLAYCKSPSPPKHNVIVPTRSFQCEPNAGTCYLVFDCESPRMLRPLRVDGAETKGFPDGYHLFVVKK